jgi:hypothetical protein
MPSRIGTVLPRKSIAWWWVIVTSSFTLYFAWGAMREKHSWLLPTVVGSLAALICLEPHLRKRGKETIQVDEAGVLRVDRDIHEQIHWDDVSQIQIVTTDDGPYREDVFFVLLGQDGKGCLVPHDAAVRTDLLAELQRRFQNLDNELVIKAMSCTSNSRFVVWTRNAPTPA